MEQLGEEMLVTSELTGQYGSEIDQSQQCVDSVMTASESTLTGLRWHLIHSHDLNTQIGVGDCHSHQVHTASPHNERWWATCLHTAECFWTGFSSQLRMVTGPRGTGWMPEQLFWPLRIWQFFFFACWGKKKAHGAGCIRPSLMVVGITDNIRQCSFFIWCAGYN